MKNNEKFCQYCYETDGTINNDVFIEIFDPNFGKCWVCKDCFLQAQKEKDEEYARLNEYAEKVQETMTEVFGDNVDFCEKCVANGKCNGSCCYEQIKEMFEGVE